MSRWRPTISPEVRALLEREREIPPQPAAVRARAVARARSSLVTRDATLAAPPAAARRIRWAAAVIVVCAASAALGAAAYAIHARRTPLPTARPAPPPAEAQATPRRPLAAVDPIARAPSAPVPPGSSTAAEATADGRPATVRAIGAPGSSRAEALRGELRLLRRARAAVGRGDFAAALVPIAEHARQFKDGRMTEEREALRVKALAELGRMDEARRAAASFQVSFPHSVLLPAVGRMTASGP